jgi:hypothetical protein
MRASQPHHHPASSSAKSNLAAYNMVSQALGAASPHSQQQQQHLYHPPPASLSPSPAPPVAASREPKTTVNELEQWNAALTELEKRLGPPWYKRLSTWVVALALMALLALVLLGTQAWSAQNEMRAQIEAQQVRLRKLGLDSAMHHHEDSVSLAPDSSAAPGRGKRGSPAPPRPSDTPQEEARDVLDSAWSARIDIPRWERVTAVSAANSSFCAAPFQSRSTEHASLPKLEACTFVDSPGSFSWDDLERFDLCCLGEHARLLCGVPSEVAPVSGDRAALALYESSASVELARRPRRCTLYVVVESS